MPFIKFCKFSFIPSLFKIFITEPNHLAYLLPTTGIPCFIALHLIALHRCCIFYNWKQDPSPAKRLQLGLLQWFGTEPTMSSRYARTQPGLTAESRGIRYGLVIYSSFILRWFSQLCPPLCQLSKTEAVQGFTSFSPFSRRKSFPSSKPPTRVWASS